MRPALAIGRFANRVFERFVVDGLVSGTEETVRGAGGVVRAVQNGFVRSYALLLIAGFAGLALYFLLSQLMINSLLWTPLAFGIVGLFLPKRVTGWWATLGAVVTLGIAIAHGARLRLRQLRPAGHGRRRPGSPGSASTTASASTGSTSS